MKQCVYKSSLLVCWNKTFIIGENPTKCWFSVNFVIQKADKGNTIVILDKESYLKSVEALLKDSSKFKNIPIAPNKDLNYKSP